MNTPVEYGVKISNNDEDEMINFTTFKSLVGSLRYLACIHPNIFFGVWLVRRFMRTPTITHFKAFKWILWYIKGVVDFDLFYDYSNSFELKRL